jgi:hypothetical protein
MEANKYLKFLWFVMDTKGDTELDAETLSIIYKDAQKKGIKPLPKFEEAFDMLLDDDEEDDTEEDDTEEDDTEEVDTEVDDGEKGSED